MWDGNAQTFLGKEPDKPVSKVLDPKTISRITADFEPFQKGQIELGKNWFGLWKGLSMAAVEPEPQGAHEVRKAWAHRIPQSH